MDLIAGAWSAGVGVIVLAIVVVLLVALYFLPTIIAVGRHHANAAPIGVLNLLLGWTFIGWVAALVWSFTSPASSVSIVNQPGYSAPPFQGPHRGPPSGWYADPSNGSRMRYWTGSAWTNDVH